MPPKAYLLSLNHPNIKEATIEDSPINNKHDSSSLQPRDDDPDDIHIQRSSKNDDIDDSHGDRLDYASGSSGDAD